MIEKISVVIPTYNRAHCVMDAVNSALNQKGNFDYEIIVSDDGSTDNTEQLFKDKKDPRLKYVKRKKNGGVNAARNTGIKHSNGEYILCLDSDDELTRDAFIKIDSVKNKLGKVNFMGTVEKNTKKKMYKIRKKGRITYKDWLGNTISGELIGFVHKSVYKEDMYDEKRFCFESFFWNRIIKKHGATIFDVPIRLYEFEGDDRMSKALLEPKKAKKRYEDYKAYLEEFGEDYLKLGLKKEYAENLFKEGFYAILSEDAQEGRRRIKKSLKYKFTIKTTAVLFFSYLGSNIFKKIYKIYIRTLKV